LRIRFPKGFDARIASSNTDAIKGAPGYRYEDTEYLVSRQETAAGTTISSVTVVGTADRQVSEATLLIKRRPYLSTTPERVTLGSRPVRAFLVCPDEDVELRRVLQAPAGIRAIVASPREVSVSLKDDAPAVIDGVIDVETSATVGNPLRIRVVRYSAETAGVERVAESRDQASGPHQANP
jgi:hypothetical protein